MAGDTVITVVGNLTADPELRFTPSGAAVANFTVASTPRTFDKNSNEWKDGEALFLRCSVWRQAAENVAESLHRGTAVIVQGRLKQRSYETKEGEKRTVIRARRRRGRPVPEVGHREGHQGLARWRRRWRRRLRRRRRRWQSYGGGGGGGAGGASGGDDPWATTAPAAAVPPVRRLVRRAPLLRHTSDFQENEDDGQATAPQAQEEGLPVLQGQGDLRRLQGHRHRCASTSRTAARSARAGSAATAASTSATSPWRSRTAARWRCCPTPRRRADMAALMKLILTQDVTGLGAPGDVVEVGPRLRPQLPRARRAWPSRPPGVPRSRSRRSAGPARSARSATSATRRRSRASSPASRSRLPARSGDGGRLFGSITSADVVAAVSKAGGPKLDRRLISSPTPIKSLGRTPSPSRCTPRSRRPSR